MPDLSFTRSARRTAARYAVLWGLPCGVILAVWQHGNAYGFGWRSLWTPQFAPRLVIALISFGLSGLLFGFFYLRAMRALGFPIPGPDDKDSDSAA